MTLGQFVSSRPHLYHLTHRDNVASIIQSKRIESAAMLAERVGLQGREIFLSTRRAINTPIGNEHHSFILRDQAQIKENALRRSLIDCTYEQYINLLNSRVFFWPTLRDVAAHYGTYATEGPRILRFNTAEVFALNNPPLFCKFNSGATRLHPYYNGNPAPRSLNTFVNVENLNCVPSKVREVTFGPFCVLPETLTIAERPDQEFVQP